MVVGTARASLIAAKTSPVFSFTITTNQVNANLRSLANAYGYNGISNVLAVINPGVDLYASDINNFGLTVGSFPAGSIVTLINYGAISGAGGAGGTPFQEFPWPPYPPSTPIAAQNGGPAFNATSISGFTFRINNSGSIRGGGGGGGYGAASYTDADVNYPYNPYDGRCAGSGGGGGQGTVGGAPGPSGNYAGSISVAGIAGSVNGPGAGGGTIANNNGVYAGDAGAGGTWGQPGQSGTMPPTPHTFIDPETGSPIQFGILSLYGPGAGGAGGISIYGVNRPVWLYAGTILGPMVNA